MMITGSIRAIGTSGILKNTNMPKKNNVLILGATGMLGSMVVDVFARDPQFNTIATIRSNDSQQLMQKKYPKIKWIIFDAEKDSVDSLQPILIKTKWVINCIGIIKPYIHDNNPTEVGR